MTDWFWKKLEEYAGWIAALVLLGVVVFMSNIEIKDLDLWLHLASGRYMTTTLTIPQVDFLSCTIPGKVWINHEWLFQVIVYNIYNLGGVDGLILMQVIVVGFTFALLFYLGYTKKNTIFQIFILMIVLLVYQLRLTHRPDLFSLFFLVFYIHVIASQINSKKVFISLFILQVLWTNFHGFFILGPILVLLNILSEWIKRRIKLPFEWNTIGRLNDREYINLIQAFFVVIAACFVNPQFIEGALYPLGVFSSLSGDSKIFFSKIMELQPPILFSNIFSFQQYLQYKILILFSVISFVFNRRKIDIGLFMLWVVFLIFSLSAVRNVVFFAIISYFVIIANSQNLDFACFVPEKFRGKNTSSILSVVFCVVLVWWMIGFVGDLSLRGYFDFDKLERKQEIGGVSLRNFPYKAANFLYDNDIKGNFFNDFNSGAYLLGRVHPNIKVFIDGRTEVYGSDLFKEQSKIFQGDSKVFESAVNKYDISGVFLGYVYAPVPSKFIKYLYDSQDWVLVYFDYDASVFLRRVAANKDIINKFEIDLSNHATSKLDLVKVGSMNIRPYRFVNRANALFDMGFYDKATEEVKEALRITPHYAEPYKILGKIFRKNKNATLEFESFRIARMLDRRDRILDFDVALSLFHIGEVELAEKRCLKILNVKATRMDVLLLLSLISLEKKDKDKALRYMYEAMDSVSRNVDGVVNVLNALCNEGFVDDVTEAYGRAKSIDGFVDYFEKYGNKCLKSVISNEE